MEELLNKIPPQNLEAEMSVLGSMLIEKEAIHKALNLVNEKSFYQDQNQKVFNTIVSLYDKDKAVDLITVSEELNKRKLLKSIGGAGYLTNLINSVTTAANVEHYAKIVREKYILRSLINVATKIVEDSYSDTEEVEKILDKAEQNIFSISESKVTPGFVAVKDMIEDTIEMAERLYSKKKRVTGVSTGLRDLDNLTAGLHPSNLVIIAGRPAMGKTSFALNIAKNVGVYEKMPVAVFSLEMDREELLLRLLCIEAKINSRNVRTGFLGKRDWTTLTNAAARLSEAPIFIDDTPSISVLEMKAKARRLKAEHGLSLVIVDYLQLMPGKTGRSEYRQQDISEISRSLKNMAKEIKVPVIAISQLSRATEQRQSKRPQLSDLRESGAIEQDADVVAFIYREDYYDTENRYPEKKGVAEIIIGKQRNGPTGVVQVAFQPEYTRFQDIELTRRPEEALT